MRDIFYAPRRTGEIRPRPNVALRKGAKFAMCNGTTCRGESCTFAHSPEEMRIWNSQLSDLDGRYKAIWGCGKFFIAKT